MRRIELVEARESLSAPNLFLTIPREDVMRLYREYRAKTKGRKIVLQHKKEGHYFVVPYVTRFDSEYIIALRRRKKAWLETARKYRCSLFVTLTIDPKEVTSLDHARKKLAEEWRKLSSVMFRDFKNGNQSRFRFDCSGNAPFYIKCYEFHRDGKIHLHAVICGVYRVDLDWLRRMVSGRNRVERIKYGAKGAINYVMKYILKGIGEGEENMNAVLGWGLWLRTFSLSRSVNICNRHVPKWAEFTELVWGFVPPKTSKYEKVAVVDWLPDYCRGFIPVNSTAHTEIFTQLLLESVA